MMHALPKRNETIQSSTAAPYVGVYVNKSKIVERISYAFFFSSDREDISMHSTLAIWGEAHSLAAIKRMPEPWGKEICEYVNATSIPHYENLVKIGYIDYIIENTTARSAAYYPRTICPNTAIMLPYWLEAIAVSNLSERGITHISTSSIVSDKRTMQLRRVNLPKKTRIGISQWLNGMGHGIRQRMEPAKMQAQQ